MIDFNKIEGFDWDDGNFTKNEKSHEVLSFESEEMFFNKPIFIYDDEKHSKTEKRYYALGITNQERKLFSVFTIRNNKIRIISSRDMSKKERGFYETNT